MNGWILLSCPRLDAVVLVNKSMLEHPKFIRRINEKFHVVDNGIKSEIPNQYPCSKFYSQHGSDLKIVAVGRLSTEKGFEFLLKALTHVVNKFVDVSLVILGEGGKRQKLQNLINRLKLQERVKMPGFVQDAAATFSCFDLLVMPSLTEGLPITLLEAMRAKLPVIASRVGGIPTVIKNGDSGFLVNPGDEKELASAIMKNCSFAITAAAVLGGCTKKSFTRGIVLNSCLNRISRFILKF